MIKLDENMREIMNGNGIKPIALIEDDGDVIPIQSKGRKFKKRAQSVLKKTFKDTCD